MFSNNYRMIIFLGIFCLLHPVKQPAFALEKGKTASEIRQAPAKSSDTKSSKTLILAADPWCPYNCKAGSTKEGYIVEIVKLALKQAGFEIVYKEMGWTEAVRKAGTGEIDGIIAAIPEDAPKLVYHAEEVGLDESCFYVHKSQKWQFKSLQSLKGRQLLAVKDYSYATMLDSYIAAHKRKPRHLKTYEGTNVLSEMATEAKRNKASVMIESKTVFDHTFLGKSTELKEAGCLEATPLFIGLSSSRKEVKEISNLLSKGVLELRKSGKLKSILKKYGLKDWK